MTATREFKQQQRGVAIAMAAALAVSVVVLVSAAVADSAAPSMPFVDRLQATIHLDLFVIVWLAAAVANVARVRFFSDRDIAGSSQGAGSDAVRVAGAILQNTFEQVVLAVVTHLVVAATFSRFAATLPALVCLFSVGRLLFWAGYKRGATGRAFGFALSFYPSVLALFGSAAGSVFGWAS